MLPGLALDGVSNGAFGGAISFCQSTERYSLRVQPSNLNNILGGQFCAAMRLSDLCESLHGFGYIVSMFSRVFASSKCFGDSLFHILGNMLTDPRSICVKSQIEFGMKHIYKILLALKQDFRITEFENAKLKRRFAIQIPCILEMAVSMLVSPKVVQVTCLTSLQANSRTDVARLIGRTVNLVNPAYSLLGWIHDKIWHSLGFLFNLRASGRSSAVTGVSASNHYNTGASDGKSPTRHPFTASLKPAHLPLFRAGLSWTTNG